jgi:hypothetical protein
MIEAFLNCNTDFIFNLFQLWPYLNELYSIVTGI